MTERITIASPSGGCGRSALALHLAVALGSAGRRTLLVDLDPSNGIAHALGRGDRALRGVADVLALDAAPTQVILPTRCEGVSLLARGRLDPVDVGDYERLLSEPGRLESVLSTAERGFDRVVLDVPAGVGALPRAALRASTAAVITVAADAIAVRALSQPLRLIEWLRAHENPRLQLLGLVLNRVDLKSPRTHSAIGALWDGFEAVCDVTIPASDAIAEAAERGVPTGFLGARGAGPAKRFEALARELEARLCKTEPKVSDDDDAPRPFL